MKRRVVVTGLGAIIARRQRRGDDLACAARRALRRGADHEVRRDATFPVRFACEVKGFDPLQYMDRKEAKRADRYTQYAVAAAVQAMQDAGFADGNGYDPDATGVIIGSGIGGLKSFEEQHDVYRERGPEQDLAVLHPDVHRRHRGRHRLDALQREGAELRDRLGVRDERARHRRRVPHHPVRRRRRDDHRRLRGDRHADGDRRLREHEGAVRAQRLAGDRVASVRRDARRLRHGRGRGRRDPRGARARRDSAARRSTPRSSATARRATRTTSRSRRPTARARSARCGAR